MVLFFAVPSDLGWLFPVAITTWRVISDEMHLSHLTSANWIEAVDASIWAWKSEQKRSSTFPHYSRATSMLPILPGADIATQLGLNTKTPLRKISITSFQEAILIGPSIDFGTWGRSAPSWCGGYAYYLPSFSTHSTVLMRESYIHYSTAKRMLTFLQVSWGPCLRILASKWQSKTFCKKSKQSNVLDAVPTKYLPTGNHPTK